MNKLLQRNIEISEICMLAGKIMLESGAETYRVEDTMNRIAHSFGIEGPESYVTPTAIIFSIEGDYPTKTRMKRITKRTTDLNKVTAVNSISRQISAGVLTIEEAYEKLKAIEKNSYVFPFWIQVLAAALSSGCFVIMFRGTWIDFLPGIIAGGVGFLYFLLIDRLITVRFFSELSASFVIGLIAIFLVNQHIGLEVDKIIIGSVMPIVPGLLITNAIRDLLAGHLVSGLAKGIESLLTAMAIGLGVAVALVLF